MTDVMDLRVGPSHCHLCGGGYGQHDSWCPYMEKKNRPRRFRVRLENNRHPTGRDAQWLYGVYFPTTDLCVTEMARPGTGRPADVEWLDPENE